METIWKRDRKSVRILNQILNLSFGSRLDEFSVECHTAAELGRDYIDVIYELTFNNMCKLFMENDYDWDDEEERILYSNMYDV